MGGLIGIVVFAVFAIGWIGFAAGIILSQGSLDGAWQWRSLPLILQGVVALLLLPVVIGLWVWETSWPLSAEHLDGGRNSRRPRLGLLGILDGEDIRALHERRAANTSPPGLTLSAALL